MANENNGGQRNGPPDLDDILRRLWLRIVRLSGVSPRPETPGPNPLGIIIGVAFGLWLVSGFYVVDAGQQAVIFRLGSYQRCVSAGLHWQLPYPIENRELVHVGEPHSVTLAVPADEAGMLTADQRLIAPTFNVTYTVSSARDLLLNTSATRDAGMDDLVKPIADAVVRHLIAASGANQVHIGDHTTLTRMAQAQMQAALDRQHAGLHINQVSLTALETPEPLRAEMADIDSATKNTEQLRHDAQAYAADLATRTQSAAALALQQAKTDQQHATDQARSDTARFMRALTQYQKAPQSTRDRMYFDTMQEILSHTTKVLVDQKPGSSPMVYLPLDKITALNLPDAEHVASTAPPLKHSISAAPLAAPSVSNSNDDGRDRERSVR